MCLSVIPQFPKFFDTLHVGPRRRRDPTSASGLIQVGVFNKVEITMKMMSQSIWGYGYKFLRKDFIETWSFKH
jgi:hypothetical protein